MKDEDRDGNGEVAESRKEVEARVAELRAAIGRETGVVPRARYTLLALVAGAAGLALAAGRRKRKRRGRSREK